MAPPKVGAAPQRPVQTTSVRAPTRVAQADPPVAQPTGGKRSSRFDTVKPPAPPTVQPYEAFGINPAGAQGNQVMPSKTGPIPAGMWKNTPELVGNLRQDTGRAGDVSGDDRCGPTNLLASRLLSGGSKAAADFLAAEAKSKNLSPAEQKRLTDLSKAVRSESATFDDLNEATTLLYKAANTRTSYDQFGNDPAIDRSIDVGKLGGDFTEYRNLHFKALSHPEQMTAADAKRLSELITKGSGVETKVSLATDPRNPKKHFLQVAVNSQRGPDHSGLDDGELAAFAKAGGLKPKSGAIEVKKVEEGYDVTASTLKKMGKGESRVLRVGLTTADTDPNHFVTIGKLPDGRPYIYNPSPQGGEPTLRIGRAKDPQTDQFTAATDELDLKVRADRDGAIPRTMTVR